MSESKDGRKSDKADKKKDKKKNEKIDEKLDEKNYGIGFCLTFVVIATFLRK